jgi:hypothetical protein
VTPLAVAEIFFADFTQLNDDDDEWDWVTEIPIAPPILPLETPMRKGIVNKATSSMSIYDKVVQQAQTPACPINLGIMIDSIVLGWKRDGEWGDEKKPPVPAPRTAPFAAMDLFSRPR